MAEMKLLDKTEQSDRASNPNEKPESCYCSALPMGSGLCLPCYTRWLATVGMTSLEAKVLHAIERRLAAPDLIAEYVREYHRLSRAVASDKAKIRARIERQLVDVKAECNRIVDAILTEKATRTLSERLAILEAQRADLEGKLETAASPPVELHPRAGDLYRQQVADLKALAS